MSQSEFAAKRAKMQSDRLRRFAKKTGVLTALAGHKPKPRIVTSSDVTGTPKQEETGSKAA